MDWGLLYFGKLCRGEITKCVVEEEWQEVRVSMKGVSLESKYSILKEWLEKNNYSRNSKVQVTNYVTALSRGGLIKPQDYVNKGKV